MPNTGGLSGAGSPTGDPPASCRLRLGRAASPPDRRRLRSLAVGRGGPRKSRAVEEATLPGICWSPVPCLMCMQSLEDPWSGLFNRNLSHDPNGSHVIQILCVAKAPSFWFIALIPCVSDWIFVREFTATQIQPSYWSGSKHTCIRKIGHCFVHFYKSVQDL